MNKIKYFAFDLDGTLLTSDLKLTNNTKEKLLELQSMGNKIVLISGRDFSSIINFANEIELEKNGGYIVSYNGAEIYEYIDKFWKKTKERIFTKSEIEELCNITVPLVTSVVTISDNYISSNNLIEPIKNAKEVAGFKMDNNYIRESSKLMLVDSEKSITNNFAIIKDEIISKFKKVNIYNSLPFLIEVSPDGTSKGLALEYISKKEKSSYKEFICFGDGGNDESMFRFCARSVAVANANKLIKEIATDETLTNDDEGVFKFLNKYF